MFYRTIFVCLVGFFLVKLVKTDSQQVITFNIQLIVMDNKPTLTCDHSSEEKQLKKYTVLEGEPFTIITKYQKIINHFICYVHSNEKVNFEKTNVRNVTTVVAEKRMGNIWECEIYAHIYNQVIKPVVIYENNNYSAAYCYMKIHVRRKVPPQTILVNNMVLTANRTDLSVKDIDFTAEYQYADGDVVNVICASFLNEAQLTMEYDMAGIKSDQSTMKDISSSKMIGFVTKLHSGHNNSYMICTNTETTDYTKVMVRFVMRTTFKNIVSISINGMILRPNLTVPKNNHYDIEYKYVRNQPINVTCEIERTNVKLLVIDKEFNSSVRDYRRDTKPNKDVMKFYVDSESDGKPLVCAADRVKGGSAEQVYINFSEGNFPIDPYPLRMELPSNGTVMELYNDYKLKIIFYEFKDGETLKLKCGPLHRGTPGPAYSLELYDNEICYSNSCFVNKILQVTRKDKEIPISCYLKDSSNPSEPKVLREIRVILRERVLTTSTSTTTTTTTSTTSTTVPQRAEVSPPRITSTTVPSPSGALASSPNEMNLTKLAVIGCSVACIIIICISIVIIKLRKRNQSQGGPHNRNYENLAEPSETSIPAYPPQWENNYAVPVDRRTDDTTYSVPCPPADLYATPTPKNLRNKKQKPVDPTYAILAVQKGKAQKNVFKETEDPNYSEVYANRQEGNYGKVLPKSVRNKMDQDNPYSYVTNEPAVLAYNASYANTGDPEPLYCEAAKAQGGQYANLNNSHYANSSAQEYVEPTYCEPQKRMK